MNPLRRNALRLLRPTYYVLPGDPADRFIVATALEHGTALVTADEKLLNWRYALERHDGTA